MVYRWEMGITRAEFVRLLPAAVNGAAFEEIDGAMHGRGWRVRVAELEPRRIAALSAPVLEVVLEVHAEEEAAAMFVARFLLGYQRAGG